MFKIETRKDAPQPKQRIATNEALLEALAGLKDGQSVLIPYAQIEKRVASVHVQRAAKKHDKLKLVTKDSKDEKGLRVWAVKI